LALPQFFFLYWQDPRWPGTSSPVQSTLPRASIVRPAKLEIPTANIAITSSGLNGDSEAVGTARSTMLATLTLVIFRENAAVMRGAKYYFHQLQSGDLPSPQYRPMGKGVALTRPMKGTQIQLANFGSCIIRLRSGGFHAIQACDLGLGGGLVVWSDCNRICADAADGRRAVRRQRNGFQNRFQYGPS
jgi:hypothetical protein